MQRKKDKKMSTEESGDEQREVPRQRSAGAKNRSEPALDLTLPKGYAGLLVDLKRRIAQERTRAVLSANAAMVMLYWEIGRAILQRQELTLGQNYDIAGGEGAPCCFCRRLELAALAMGPGLPRLCPPGTTEQSWARICFILEN